MPDLSQSCKRRIFPCAVFFPLFLSKITTCCFHIYGFFGFPSYQQFVQDDIHTKFVGSWHFYQFCFLALLLLCSALSDMFDLLAGTADLTIIALLAFLSLPQTVLRLIFFVLAVISINFPPNFPSFLILHCQDINPSQFLQFSSYSGLMWPI